MTEHDLQSLFRLRLSEAGVVLRLNVGRVRTADGRWFDTGLPPGTPDLMVVLPGGRTAWVEVKTPRGAVRPEQARFLRRLREMGHAAGVARSVQEAETIIQGGNIHGL